MPKEPICRYFRLFNELVTITEEKAAYRECRAKRNHDPAAKSKGWSGLKCGLTNQGNRRPPRRTAPPVGVRVDRVVRPRSHGL